MLVIPEHEIRRHGPGRSLLTILWRQFWTERRLGQRGIHFRGASLEQVLRAYTAMDATEFDNINARQDWANWRTIPRALSGNVPDRPLRVLDIGCGTGSSTRVLAHYCAAGSHLTGYEYAEPLLVYARRRDYRHRSGAPARVDFVCQGVTEPFAEPDGSVDLVNASGIIGHHLTLETFQPLLTELVRILKPDGLAILDPGPTLTAPTLAAVMQGAEFTQQGHYFSWFGDPCGAMVFRRGTSEPEA